MAETQRVFISINLPESFQANIATIQQLIKSHNPDHKIRITQPAGMHVTIQFLGDVPSEQISEITQHMIAAARDFETFMVDFSEPGVFPDNRKPRVVWLGLHDKDHRLMAIQQQVTQRMKFLGYLPDKRRFHPHLTLGRIKDQRPIVIDHPDIHQVLACLEKWYCDHVALMRSEPSKEGARYTVIHKETLHSRR